MVAEELIRRGFRILRRNFHARWGEIDLICQDGRTLVFVEIRSRSGGRFGTARESLSHHKQRRLLRASRAYLSGRPRTPYRFDLVAVQLEPGTDAILGIEHLQNVIEG